MWAFLILRDTFSLYFKYAETLIDKYLVEYSQKKFYAVNILLDKQLKQPENILNNRGKL